MVPTEQHTQLPSAPGALVLYTGEEFRFGEPSLDEQLSEASSTVKSLREERKRIEREMERVSSIYRSHFPQAATAIAEAEDQINDAQAEMMSLLSDTSTEDSEEGQTDQETPPEPESHERKQWRKKRKRNSKDVYGKICNLCHPDKNKGLEKDKLDELTDLFIEATGAYKMKDLDRLVEIYATVMAIRTGKTGDEIEQEKRQRLEHLRSAVEGQKHQLEELKQHIVYHITSLHNDGKRGEAKSIYGQVLSHMLNERRSMLNGIKAEIAKLKRQRDGEPEPESHSDGYFTITMGSFTNGTR